MLRTCRSFSRRVRDIWSAGRVSQTATWAWQATRLAATTAGLESNRPLRPALWQVSLDCMLLNVLSFLPFLILFDGSTEHMLTCPGCMKRSVAAFGLLCGAPMGLCCCVAVSECMSISPERRQAVAPADRSTPASRDGRPSRQQRFMAAMHATMNGEALVPHMMYSFLAHFLQTLSSRNL